MERRYKKRPKYGQRTENIIVMANEICEEYAGMGYQLTLRQLYYQFVSRGYLANRQSEYKRLGSIINDARLTGDLDWDYIVDRTRELRGNSHWGGPDEILESAARSYRTDLWATQPYRVEVWIEKDALVGVIEGICQTLDVDYFSCRGYTSQSEMWAAAQRLGGYIREGQQPVIVHLGDHDPSGIDMTRDIEDRLTEFLTYDWLYENLEDQSIQSIRDIWTHMARKTGLESIEHHGPLDMRRVALNMEQVEEYDPPPNPAKLTDARSREYVENHGYESWELDALEPQVLSGLIENEVFAVRDVDAWEEAVDAQEAGRAELHRFIEEARRGQSEEE